MKNKLKILFIKSYAYTPNQSFDVPLGVLYLSGYLKKHLKQKVSTALIDLRIHKDTKKALKASLEDFKPDIIGISTLAFEHQFLADNINFIRKYAPESQILIGGPYATSNYSKALLDNDIDYAVIGEGEAVLLNFSKAFPDKSRIRKIKGLAYKDGNTVKCNEKEDYIENLDTIPMPDYSLVDFRDYWKNRFQFNGILAENKHASVISSRACPYRCIYCHDIFGKQFRTRSASHFVNEIKYLYHTHGVREFHIIDDVFNLNRERMHDILNLIINSDMRLKIAFPNGVRGDILEKEDILLLKQAGTYMITFAIETGSERVQKLIKKNINIPKILDNINYAHQIGLITRGFFMLGFPDETIDEMKLTVKTAAQSRLNMASFFIVVPFKNTELYDIARNQLSNTDEDFLSAYIATDSFYEKVTGYNVSRLQKYAYLRFYSPIRLLKLFLIIPKKRYQVTKWMSFAYELLKQ